MDPLTPLFTISKDFHLSASHVLTGLAEGHPCMRLHGHNYIVRASLQAAVLDGHGFVRDYGDLAPFAAVVDRWDHQHLNDLPPFAYLSDEETASPTAERMAAYLCDLLAGFVMCEGWRNVTGVAVSVSETPKTWASCSMALTVPS